MVNCVGLAESKGVARYFIAGSGFTVVDKHGGNGLFVLHDKILDTSTNPLPSDWTVSPTRTPSDRWDQQSTAFQK